MRVAIVQEEAVREAREILGCRIEVAGKTLVKGGEGCCRDRTAANRDSISLSGIVGVGLGDLCRHRLLVYISLEG